MAFKVCFVCTGNQCRSPVADIVFRSLTEGLPVEVSSAGTLETRDRSVPRDLLEVARLAGVDLSEHRSRSVRTSSLGDLDLVVGMATEHVAAAVVDAGAPLERSFTLIELVRLLEQAPIPDDPDPDKRATRAVEEAHRRRQASDTFVPDEDVADPIGGPRSGYEEMTSIVRDLCERLARALFGHALSRN